MKHIGHYLSPPICHILGFLYPAYASFKALKTLEGDDDKQWLSYWIIYGFFCVAEFWIDALFSKIPLYWEMKILLVLWLQLPQFRGAVYLYHRFVEPFLIKNQDEIDAGIAHLSKQAKDALKAGTKKVIKMAYDAMQDKDSPLHDAAETVKKAVVKEIVEQTTKDLFDDDKSKKD